MTVFKNDVSRAVNILGDCVSNARLDAGELEILKQEIAADHASNHTDMMGTTLENAHYNAFRDHMMGQPIKGDADILAQISSEDLA